MIQGNVNIDGDLIIEQPLDNYDGTVKYAINDSNGNPLTEYPSSDEYDNFSLECKWKVFSTKYIGIDNTNNEFNVNTVTYGNGICIITFINSKYIAQSLDYGDTWDLIDMGYVATRTSKFIIDTHFIIDYKRIYKLKEGEKFISSNNDITPSDLSFNDKESLIASDNNTNTLMVYTIYTSDTLKFDVKLNDDIIEGDRETIGLDINDNIKIKSVIFDTNLNKFVILNNTNKLILVDLEKNITSVNLTEEFDYMINTGAKQIFASKDKKYILYTNDMNEFNKIDLPYDEKWTNLKYVNGVYFLLTEKSEYILVSKDGIKWKYISELPIVSTWVDIIYKNNTYYLIDNKSNIITYNGDDITAKNITFNMEKVSKEVVSKNIYNYDNIFIITCEENKICVKKDSKWEIISNDNLGKNMIYYLNKNIYIFNGINKTNKLILSGVTNNYIDNTISGNTDSKYCIDFNKAVYSTDLFINSYYLSKLNSSNLYLLTDNIESSTNQISDPYTLSIGDNNVIKDIVRSKNKSLLVTSDNTKLSIFNIIDKNNNITTSLIDDMNTINTINNPIIRYGRGSFVTVNKSSSETFIIDLFDNINHYNNSNDILNSDKIIDMKFINGLFLAIGTNSLFYSDFGFNWHKKSIIDTTDMELNENNLSGSIVYIPDKQRLLIINTSYKDKSYVAIYDNLIGMVKHFNDANYSLFDIHSHVKKLLDISVIDE